MIREVARVISTDCDTGKTMWSYTVAYESGRWVKYGCNKHLPITVVEFLLNADCETMYVTNCPHPYKLEKYTK